MHFGAPDLCINMLAKSSLLFAYYVTVNPLLCYLFVDNDSLTSYWSIEFDSLQLSIYQRIDFIIHDTDIFTLFFYLAAQKLFSAKKMENINEVRPDPGPDRSPVSGPEKFLKNRFGPGPAGLQNRWSGSSLIIIQYIEKPKFSFRSVLDIF